MECRWKSPFGLPLLALILLLTLGALGARPLQAQASEGADAVAEFHRFYTKERSPQERLEAVMVLRGIDSLPAAQALAKAFEDEDFTVRRAAIDALCLHTRPETATWLADEVLLGKKYAKRVAVRGGAAEALGAMRQESAYFPLTALLTEKEPLLRVAGMAALGHLKDPRACPLLTQVVLGGDEVESLAALSALIEIGSTEGATDAVLAALQHADWRIRAKAIEAVIPLRLKAAVRSLIGMLGTETGRLSGDAYSTLKAVTLRDFGDEPTTWLTWWDRAESTFKIPDLEAVRAAQEKAEREGTKYSKGKKSFLGLETKSENILFVIDVSGSMETPFGDPERLKATGRTYSSLQRLAIVKEELSHTIKELPDTTSFNVIAFATNVFPWKKDTVKANVLNKNNALAWVARLKPLGGQADAFKDQTGLSSGSTSEGATNTHLALMSALGESVDGDKGRGELVLAAPKTPLDTIYFLTDGEPTVGKSVDMSVIRNEVRRVNEFRGVQIHVIYVGEFGGDDFERLARENRGIFVAIGG